VDLPTTQTLVPALLRGLTIFMREKTETSTAMTGKMEIGLRTVAADGSLHPNLRPIYNSNSRHALRGSSAVRTSVARWVVEREAAVAEEDSQPLHSSPDLASESCRLGTDSPIVHCKAGVDTHW